MGGDFDEFRYPYGGMGNAGQNGQRSQGSSRQAGSGPVPNTNQPFVPFQGQPRTLDM